MARSRGQSIPKYRKHRATGQAVCTISGRDYYLGPHNSKASKIEYDRLVSEWLVAGRPNATIVDNELSVNELIARFWKHAQKRYLKHGKPTSELPLIQLVMRHVRELYGRKPVSEFGPLALKAVRSKLIEKDWARKTINDATKRIVRMFRWGVAEQLVEPNILEALRAVEGLRKGSGEARETKPIRPVEEATVKATIEHLPAVVADMVKLQRLTGSRPAEVCSLRPCDIDRSGEIWLYCPASHKTEHRGRERIVFLGPQSQRILSRYLARDSHLHCFRSCESEQGRRAKANAERKTPLSCGNTQGSNRKQKPKRQAGELYTNNSYRRAIHRACDRAKVERWSPNRLRHSAATEIRREFGLEAAQVILGHSQANVTQVYAERDMKKGLEVARQIG